MREILFKAKKWDSKEWVEGSLITLDADSGYYFISEPYTGASTLPVRDLIYNHTYLIDAKTICQYTGLTDKNGNKIWENDIVEVPRQDGYFLIQWSETQACWEMDNEIESIVCDFDNYWSYDAEVVGNLIDNPSLIGQ